ncbi:unnamed protein product (mitochondrion) [Plasmodiophora brassicae]|uniref:Uncharacterized protein n=1 Tax=Plasmodiophora brassicae TaxID=37360 RepID=A0A3P3YIS7_PLABS|nr:unnamed protein product [Plasmodiophora brassicae]
MLAATENQVAERKPRGTSVRATRFPMTAGVAAARTVCVCGTRMGAALSLFAAVAWGFRRRDREGFVVVVVVDRSHWLCFLSSPSGAVVIVVGCRRRCSVLVATRRKRGSSLTL